MTSSQDDLNWYFIKIVAACVLLNDNGGSEQWVMILLCWTLHSAPHTGVYTPSQPLVTFRLLSSRDIAHNLDLGRYIKKQETTSDTRLILLTRTWKIQGYIFNFEIFVLCGSWSKFCFVSFQILDQIGQTKRYKNGLYLGFIWINFITISQSSVRSL